MDPTAASFSPPLSVPAPDAGSEPRGLGIAVVVPTRNEADNVCPLLERVARATAGLDVEVIFVDDSTDATPDAIRAARDAFPFPVRLIARPPERRNGLGMAVVEGIGAAERDWVCVMDGDLQHPPEVLPQLLDHARATRATLVAASRLSDGGGTAGLSPFRTLVSYALALASRLLFPRRMRQLSDPLTGFFLLRRDAVDLDRLRPEGFKILLEIIVRSPNLVVAEIPFEFAERHAGESKANSTEVLRLFRQMLRLSFGAYGPLLRFGLVGGAGLVVNLLATALFGEALGLHYLLAAALATQVSTFGNFVGTEYWVFPQRRASRRELPQRVAGFFAMNNAALLLRGPLIVALVALLGFHYLLATAVSLVLLMMARFFVSERLLWRDPVLATATTVQVQPRGKL